MNQKNMSMVFDTDSVKIGVDNQTSYSMSNNENNFIGPIIYVIIILKV